MRIPLFQVDAFAAQPFAGNPAAVCLLDQWLPDELLQAIAAENNLSETAFTVAKADGYDLRWFTPALEVDLCGHATLAAAKVIFGQRPELGQIDFSSRSGNLSVRRIGEQLELDFPSQPGTPVAPSAAMVDALGRAPREVLRSVHYDLARFDDEAAVRALHPDEAGLRQLDCLGVIATAPGDEVDFVSRFFAPNAGVFEDPVTGSAHCVLVPYWAKQLERVSLSARQISRRGGELWCELRNDRVAMRGHAVLVVEGELILP